MPEVPAAGCVFVAAGVPNVNAIAAYQKRACMILMVTVSVRMTAAGPSGRVALALSSRCRVDV